LVILLPRPAQTQFLKQHDVAPEESQDKAQKKAHEGENRLFLHLSVKQHAADNTSNYAKGKIPANPE